MSDIDERFKQFKQQCEKQMAEARNNDARAAICFTLCGIILVGVPYFGWFYLMVCFIVAIVAMRKSPRGLAVAALLLDLLMLWLKVLITTTV